MEIGLARGIVLRKGKYKVVFDPKCGFKKKVNLAIFSHAHSDHIRSINNFSNALATKETVKIAEKRYFGDLSVSFLEYGSENIVNGITVALYNSGHVLGSAQTMIRLKDKDILYTGDLKTAEGLTTEAAEPISSDILIIESTYGSPSYAFPPRNEVYQRITRWVEERFNKGISVLVGGYVLGKAQELTKMFNNYGIVPLVHPKIYEINKLYEDLGVKLGKYINTESEEGTELMNSGDFVCIVPPSNIKERILDGLRWLSGSAHISTAVATGWAVDPVVKLRYGCEKAFPLSDHADFKELIEFVRSVDPEIVYTTHGFANRLAKEIKRELGIQAKPVGLFEQKKIFDFFIF